MLLRAEHLSHHETTETLTTAWHVMLRRLLTLSLKLSIMTLFGQSRTGDMLLVGVFAARPSVIIIRVGRRGVGACASRSATEKAARLLIRNVVVGR